MGQSCCKDCPLKPEELEEYELLTFLCRSEILAAFRRFSALNPSAVERNRAVRLPADLVVSRTPALDRHPLGDRVCRAFSSERDGLISFDDYLDLCSVLSARASVDIKTHFAFLALDFDGDGVVGKADLGRAVDRVFHTRDKHLTNDEKRRIVERILDEVDADKDGFICKPEFKFAVARCPDFFHAFKIHLD